jgi:hypothetical protein
MFAMARKYIFADECGNFDFSSKAGASRYFILVTITVETCAVGHQILELRRELAFRGVGLDREFHAATDEQKVRDEVFAAIVKTPLRVDAVILEKSKTYPYVRSTEERFYKTAWHQHMKFVAPRVVSPGDELLVVSASIGTNKKRHLFHAAVSDVLRQVSPTAKAQVASWNATSDPCLQVADYCAWAIQRKWERGDLRSYELIKPFILSEFDLFALGKTRHY